MNDRQMKHDVVVILIMLVLVGLSYAVVTSKTFQEYQFLRDCSERWPQEYCEELWSMGNE